MIKSFSRRFISQPPAPGSSVGTPPGQNESATDSPGSSSRKDGPLSRGPGTPGTPPAGTGSPRAASPQITSLRIGRQGSGLGLSSIAAVIAAERAVNTLKNKLGFNKEEMLKRAEERNPEEVERLGRFLKEKNVFSNLDSNTLLDVCRHAVFKPVPMGEIIFREGDTADRMYVILKGRVAISRKQIGAVSYFPKPRSAEEEAGGKKTRRKKRGSAGHRKKSTSAGAKPGSGGPQRRGSVAATAAAAAETAPDTHRTEEGTGDEGEGGEDEADDEGSDGEDPRGEMVEVPDEVILARLGEADVFGQVALLENKPRNATVTCEIDCEFLYIMKSDYNRCIKAAELKAIRERVDFLRRVPIFHRWGTAVLEKLAVFFTEKILERGKVVVDKGDKAKYVYFIKEGECGIVQPITLQTRTLKSRSRECEVGVVSTGEYFGDQEALTGKHHALRIVCNATTRVLVLNRSDFLHHVANHKEALRVLKQVHELHEATRRDRLQRMGQVLQSIAPLVIGAPARTVAESFAASHESYALPSGVRFRALETAKKEREAAEKAAALAASERPQSPEGYGYGYGAPEGRVAVAAPGRRPRSVPSSLYGLERPGSVRSSMYAPGESAASRPTTASAGLSEFARALQAEHNAQSPFRPVFEPQRSPSPPGPAAALLRRRPAGPAAADPDRARTLSSDIPVASPPPDSAEALLTKAFGAVAVEAALDRLRPGSPLPGPSPRPASPRDESPPARSRSDSPPLVSPARPQAGPSASPPLLAPAARPASSSPGRGLLRASTAAGDVRRASSAGWRPHLAKRQSNVAVRIDYYFPQLHRMTTSASAGGPLGLGRPRSSAEIPAGAYGR